jgi:hypothetical protein
MFMHFLHKGDTMTMEFITTLLAIVVFLQAGFIKYLQLRLDEHREIIIDLTTEAANGRED